MSSKSYLILQDGTVFQGKAFGYEGETTGEVVFNTSMVGYPETLTDPGYYGQIVVQTFPLTGNYGIIPEDIEGKKVYLKAYIAREWCEEPSNFRCQETIDNYLKENKIPGLYGIDTRALTKIIREKGVMNGKILQQLPQNLSQVLEELNGYAVEGGVAETTCKEIYDVKSTANRNKGKTVIIYHCGAEAGAAAVFAGMGYDVKVVPAVTDAEQILAFMPAGIFVTDGPGNPAENTELIGEIRKLFESGTPMFGAGLGHQLIALAAGGGTEKMKYGHRGGSQPVRRMRDRRIFITSQNHGYYVQNGSIPEGSEISYINVNDRTCEGLRYKNKPVFSVQFVPDVCGGPHDFGYLFREFAELMEGGVTDAVK